jgi:hypothetical protein
VSANGQVSFKQVDLIGWWRFHPQRKSYYEVFFDPSKPKEHENRLNDYDGLAVVARRGSWRRMLRHIWRIICNRDKEKFEYLIKLMAWTVQHPDQLPGVAVVIQGKKGGGKGVLPSQFVKIFGRHALAISSRNDLVGRFTGHLETTVFLLADEAYFPGDKQVEGKLKQLLTEGVIASEAKFGEAKPVRNFLHVWMCSNESWVVPATDDERRFFVCEIDNYFADTADEARERIEAEGGKVASADEKHAYFAALWAEMDHGGRGAMLYDLQRMKLGDWHPRQVVKTAELEQQVRQGIMYLDRLEDELAEYKDHRILIDDVRLLLFGKATHHDFRDNKAMKTAMEKLGWVKQRLKHKGANKNHYVKGEGNHKIIAIALDGGRVELKDHEGDKEDKQ